MINQGTFDELIKVSDNFRIIAKIELKKCYQNHLY